MTPSHAPCPNCREAFEEKDERIRQLEALAFATELVAPSAWRLTPAETVLIRLLVAHERVRFNTFAEAMSAGRWDYNAEPKIIDIYICKLRKKLSPFGVEIVTHWGDGWGMERPMREAVRAAMSGGSPQVGAPVTKPIPEPLTPAIMEMIRRSPRGATGVEIRAAFSDRPGAGALLNQMLDRGELRREPVKGTRTYRYFATAQAVRGAA